MPITCRCERCGKTLRVKDELAGKHAKCPGCGGTIRVPQPQEGGRSGGDPATVCRMAAKLRMRWREAYNLDKAERLFAGALRRWPDFWMPHYGLGELLLVRAGESRTLYLRG